MIVCSAADNWFLVAGQSFKDIVACIQFNYLAPHPICSLAPLCSGLLPASNL